VSALVDYSIVTSRAMTVRWAWRAIVQLVLVAFVIAAGPRDAPAERAQQNSLDDLAEQVGRLYEQGKYADAVPIAERYVALARKTRGDGHPKFARAILWLAKIYESLGRYNEAEPLLKRALAIDEKSYGPQHTEVATDVSDLGTLYYAQGRYAEAEPLYKRALAIKEMVLGNDHLDVATALNNLAVLYETQGRYAEAEPLSKRSLTIYEKALGSDHSDVGTSLNNLAELYRAQDRYAEAEPLYKRALAIQERALGPDHLEVATDLNNLAMLYDEQGRFNDAEPLFKRTIAIMEKALGADHPKVGTALNNLAMLYDDQGRYAEAEQLYKRSLAIREKALGPEHPAIADSLNNLAWLYYWHGRYAEAEPLYKRSLAIREKALGPDHPNVAQSLNNFGRLALAQGKIVEAESLLKRGLAIREALGPDQPGLTESLYMVGWLALAQGDWPKAAEYWRHATNVIERRAERGLGGAERESAKGEAARSGWYFAHLVRLSYRLASQGHADMAGQGREMFEVAQWARSSEAASSLAQMAARSANGSTALADVVRERQDLVAEWQAKDKQLIAAKSLSPANRDPRAEKSLSDALAAIDGRLATIDAQLAKVFPAYASFASPKPISVDEVQAELRDDEALVLFLDAPEIKMAATPEESFVWVVTKHDMRWERSALGTKALTEFVSALRCGLDATLWAEVESTNKCKGTLGSSPRIETVTVSGKDVRVNVLPFDLARAHELYKALLGPVEDIIRGKRLLIVPSGPLTSLPFNVLVTEPPRGAIPETLDAYRQVAWLGERTAITVLPSVSSLKALRQFAKTSHATKPYLGIGNPLLNGPQDDPVFGADYKRLAELARTKRCSAPQLIASAWEPRPVRSIASLFRGAEVNIEQIRYQVPLPETADELCQVARRLGVPDSEILLGANATEARVKDLSEQGRLADYAIVHFATHGALAGQVQGSTEPGLILTPPPKGTSDPKALARDNGFLTASEISTLKLDADWVVLSACNTAGAEGQGAEALSGMARAFFYAGARALLVSHWEVGSDAAVKLTTRAFAELKVHPEIGRAEAMRISMRELIEKGTPAEAHPSLWAPFVVVGEGAAR
jgi:CHAT domain-containing protein/tetratricopeptide (TPR) repeat protein